MDFKKMIEEYENYNIREDIFYKIGLVPVMLSSPHTMKQVKEDGSIKLNEPYTKAINRYVSGKTNCYSLIKINDRGLDSNKDLIDEYKMKMLKEIEDNDIKLLIDIHGASSERDFDIELGTINNLSADYSTINELKEAFILNGIDNISINEPFKGGGITRYIYGMTNIDVIQIEINRKYRDIDNIDNLKKVCDSLIYFIFQYNNK